MGSAPSKEQQFVRITAEIGAGVGLELGFYNAYVLALSPFADAQALFSPA